MNKFLKMLPILLVASSAVASTTTDGLEENAAMLTLDQSVEGTGCPKIGEAEITSLHSKGNVEVKGVLWAVAPDSQDNIKVLDRLEHIGRHLSQLKHGKVAVEVKGSSHTCSYEMDLQPNDSAFSDTGFKFTLVESK